MNHKTPVGVVGVGSLGFHHVRILSQLPNARLVGFFDVDKGRAGEVEQELGVPAYPKLEKLLADVEAVTVVVPTPAHYEVAKTALASGLHVFIEKPITTTLTEADALIGAAKEHDRILQVGHIERFNGAVRACEQYLANPLFVESHRLAPFVKRGTDVAVVLDLMIHDIDLILSLVRRPVNEVRAAGIGVLTDRIDIANARLEFEGGAVANITASRVSIQRQRKIRFFQPSGYLSLDLAAGTGEFYRRKEQSRPGEVEPQLSDVIEHVHLKGDDREPLLLELDAFVDAVSGERRVAVSGEEGREALAVALEIVDRIEKHHDDVFDSN